MKVFITFFLLSLSLFADHLTTPEDAKEMVEKVYKYIQTNGYDKAVKEVSNPKGRFIKEDIYAFIIRTKDLVTLAHPFRPQDIGKSQKHLTDITGRPLHLVMKTAAEAGGDRFVSYVWKNPKTGKEMMKKTYIKVYGDVFIGSGAYIHH